ncbi:cobalamin biosynthesis protein CobW [Aquisalimonas lutea]|uniref:cobalamin biosynthesis protein CobW n=1 Tax=Aquisalimonas lutea TaxID=1327750 RepID=UPI0025B46EC9|nr:cobalamin biosynthesis protein CobW [Aquisalimonas lutea]MDN3519539.1 cobalamin biosynthesis protein CobW [Aquisalimonas lutea]
MQLDKIHATVVTGFLGSGKTTLLANMLRNANGKRIAVIVNEFGEMDMDAELLRGCPLDCADGTDRGDGIYELANGCICCTVEEEFVPVMRKLIEQRDRIDHILIETSGLALPKPLVQAFNWPGVREHCTVDSVISVVDGPAVAAGRYASDPERVERQRLADDSLDHDPTLRELLEDQLGSADLVIVSKSDQLADGDRERVTAAVRHHLPEPVKILFVSHGEVDSELLMGLDAATEARIESVETHHDRHHAEGEEHGHAHDHFDNCVVRLGTVDSDRLLERMRALIADHAIYRVKGFAATGKPMRQVVQMVGERAACYFDRPWEPDEVPETRLVVIGRELDREQLQRELAAAEA